MASNDELRFDVIGADRLSGPFSKAGESVGTLSRKMDIGAKSALVLDEALKKQQQATRASVDATLALAKSNDILAEAEHVLADGALEAELALKRETEAKRKSGDAALDAAAKNKAFRDSLSGTGGSGSGFSLAGALPGASGIVNPYTIAAGAAAAPFAGQMAAGGIIAGFGTALAGLAILGASKTKSVEASFASLKTHASADLAQIGKPFVPVMDSILTTAKSTMDKLTPVFTGAERVIAGPFKQFGDTLVASFNQPAVRTSIDAVAVSFAKVTKALTPQLPGMIKSVADGITNIAHSVSANPKAFADFVSFLFKAAGAALNTIAWLTRTASYIEAHFGPAMHRVAVIFDGVRGEIDHVWNQIYENSVGMVIRLTHNIETQFNSWRHGTAVIFDGARHDIAHTWDQIFSNSVGAAIRVWQKTNTPFANLRHDIAGHMDGIRHDTAHYWDVIYQDTIGRVIRLGHDVEAQFNSLRHSTANIFNGVRHDLAPIWNAIWNDTIGRAIRGASNLMSVYIRLEGSIIHLFSGAANWLVNAGENVIGGLLRGIAHGMAGIGGWINSNVVQPVIGAVKHFFGISSPSTVMAGIGGHLISGLLKGVVSANPVGVITKAFGGMPQALAAIVGKGLIPFESLGGKALGALESAGGKIGGFFANMVGGGGGSGVQRWAGTVLQALKMEGLSPSLVGNVLYQMQTESGGNPNAINLTDSNAQAGDPSRGLLQTIGSTFSAFHWPGTSWNIYDPLANIAAAINYARHTYGPNLANQYGGLGSGHGYALGTMSAAPGWGWVGERGPELMHFRGGEQVVPAGRAGGGQTINIHVHVPPTVNPRDAGRQVADLLGAHIKGGGRLYPPGITPR